jgi:hypothetical protein
MTKKIIKTGIDVRIDAAEKSGQFLVYSVACNEYSPTASVYFPAPDINTVAKMYSFQTYIKTNTEDTMILGLISGRTIFVIS